MMRLTGLITRIQFCWWIQQIMYMLLTRMSLSGSEYNPNQQKISAMAYNQPGHLCAIPIVRFCISCVLILHHLVNVKSWPHWIQYFHSLHNIKYQHPPIGQIYADLWNGFKEQFNTQHLSLCTQCENRKPRFLNQAFAICSMEHPCDLQLVAQSISQRNIVQQCTM